MDQCSSRTVAYFSRRPTSRPTSGAGLLTTLSVKVARGELAKPAVETLTRTVNQV